MKRTPLDGTIPGWPAGTAVTLTNTVMSTVLHRMRYMYLYGVVESPNANNPGHGGTVWVRWDRRGSWENPDHLRRL